MDIFGKYKKLLLGLAILIFSFPSFFIFKKYFQLGYEIVQYYNGFKILCINNTLLILSLIILHMIFIIKSNKTNRLYSIIISAYFFLLIIMSFNFYFLDYMYYIRVFEIITIPNIIILIIFQLTIFKLLPLDIGYGLFAMFFTVIINFLFTKIINSIKYKDNKYNKIIMLFYYLQCNSCLVFLFSAIRLMMSYTV
jgi:hypothetical protein